MTHIAQGMKESGFLNERERQWWVLLNKIINEASAVHGSHIPGDRRHQITAAGT
jgi:hypothetical protein